MRNGPVGVFGLVLAIMLVSSQTAVALETQERRFYATVDQVLVDRPGGITVSGRLDCTEALTEAYGQEGIPPNTSVFIGMSWRAYQFVGKNKVIYAEYSPAIAHACYNTDPGVGEDVVAPWSWSTAYPYPMGGTAWVYSRDGKFSPGPIHIELFTQVTEGDVTFWVGETPYLLFHASGWDLRAVKTR